MTDPRRVLDHIGRLALRWQWLRLLILIGGYPAAMAAHWASDLRDALTDQDWTSARYIWREGMAWVHNPQPPTPPQA